MFVFLEEIRKACRTSVGDKAVRLHHPPLYAPGSGCVIQLTLLGFLWGITQKYGSYFAIQITNLIFAMNFQPVTQNAHPPSSSPMKNFVTDDYQIRLFPHSC